MRKLGERHDWSREQLERVVFRLAVYTFAAYLLVHLVRTADLYPVRSVLEPDVFGAFLLGVITLSLALSVDSGRFSSTTITAIQAVFLTSLIALAIAYASIPVLSPVSEFLSAYSERLVNLTFTTGVLSAVSVLSSDGGATFVPERGVRRGTFRRNTLPRTHVVGVLALAILGYFVRLRWSLLGKTFGGIPHSDKYAFHVPVLQWMHRTADPFYFRNEGYVSLFNPEKHVFDQFWNAPIFSWNALPLLTVDDSLAIEFVVRSVVTIQGVVLLALAFLLFREVFDAELALLGTLLLAVNEQFNLVTFLTVMDLPALVFTFASLLLYFRGQRTYAYLLCGFAALTKYSFFLITAPALAVLILSIETEKFYNLLKLGYLTVFPVVLFNFLVLPAGGESLLSGVLRLVAFATPLLLSALAIERYESTFVSAVSRVDRRTQYAMMVFGPLFGVVFLWNEISRYAPEFLTDEYLLFNGDMYLLLLDKTRALQPDVLFYLFPVGVLWFLLRGDRQKRSMVSALLVASVLYGVIASKSLFFHAYYKHVFVVVSVVGFLGVLDVVRRLDLSPKLTTPAASLLVLLLVVTSQGVTADTLNDTIRGTEEMGEYIEGNVSDSELVLRTEVTTSVMAIYSDVRIVNPSVPSNVSDAQLESLKADVESKGLGCALYERNVTHYLSVGPGQFERLTPLLTLHNRTSSNRRDAILRETNPSYQSSLRSDDVPPPTQYFELETQVGDWYLYEIQSGSEDGDCPNPGE